MGKDHGSFQRLLVYAIGHVVFDIITVLTVNNLDRVPLWCNFTAHVIFYLSAILFSQEFLCYVIALFYEKRIQKISRIGSICLLAAYLLLLPIVYLQGNGTRILHQFVEIMINSMIIPLRLAGGAFVMDEHFTGDSSAVRNNLTHALERSKQESHGRLIFYNAPSPNGTEGNFRLLTAIHQDAVTERLGFCLEYQPILQMDNGTVIGAEALLRWQDKKLGKVGPGQFVPWLENDPCFYQVGRWILQKALQDAREMLAIVPDFVVNVNITVLQLEDERFNAMVLEALRESSFPPRQLCLELTERCRELDFDFLKTQIEFFHNFGIQVALDDVGTGFSSLNTLLNLPVDEIKLDKTFITDIRTREANQAFVRAIVEASRHMGYHSCLEGIEDRETYEYLKGFGATACQGYYFSKPLPAEKLKAFLIERQR